MQLGVTPDLEDAADQFSKSKNRAKLTEGLSNVGFESLHAYEEVNVFFFPFHYIYRATCSIQLIISPLLTCYFSRIAVSVIHGPSSSPANPSAVENGGMPIRHLLT